MDPSGDGARRSLRFSFGRFNTETQVNRAIEIIPEVIEKLRGMAAPARGSVISPVTTAL
jgi:cysteine desulfurase